MPDTIPLTPPRLHRRDLNRSMQTRWKVSWRLMARKGENRYPPKGSIPGGVRRAQQRAAARP